MTRKPIFQRLAGWSGLVGGGEERPYECQTCGTRYELQHYVCPSCGSHAVDRTVFSFD